MMGSSGLCRVAYLPRLSPLLDTGTWAKAEVKVERLGRYCLIVVLDSAVLACRIDSDHSPPCIISGPHFCLYAAFNQADGMDASRRNIKLAVDLSLRLGIHFLEQV